MHISIDVRMINKTGIGRYVRNLIFNLTKIDKDNHYTLFFNKTQQKNYIDIWRNDNFKKKFIGSSIFTIKEQIEFPFHLILENIDVFHSPHFVLPLLYPSKSVVTIHDLTPIIFPEELTSKKARIYYRGMLFLAIKKANKIIAVSNYTKKDIVNIFGISPGKIEVVYEGVNDCYRPIKDKRILDHIKKKFGIDREFLLYVGLSKPHKNLVRLIKAFKILRKNIRLDLKLVIAGKIDPRYPEVRKIVDKLGLREDVIFTDFVSDQDLVLLYNAAKAFVFPSLYEGFGLPPLEAMACGTPVVSSKVASLAEVLGDAAVVFHPLDIHDMADKVYQVVSDENLRKQLSEKGIRWVKRFSWEKCARETLKIYEKVHNEKS